MIQIEIPDDFDLEKTAACGQCFRAKSIDGSLFRFISRENVVYIQKIGEHQFSVSCNEDEWREFWVRYFDLSRSYRNLYKVLSGSLDLEAIADYRDEELFQKLQTVHGVGKKVANCICLFGYGRMSRVPVDVWISRAVEEDCRGVDPFGIFEGNAGIVQQYIFYYKKSIADETGKLTKQFQKRDY